MKLSQTLHEADREIDELEFLEPTGAIFDELERAQAWNANAKRRKDIIATGLVVLEHLTGVGGSALSTMTFDDRRRAMEIAGEIMGGSDVEGEA